MDHRPHLTQWNYEPCHVGPPKMDGSWWRVLTKCGLLEKSEVAQLCPTLCNPMDCCLPGSSIHGIFQARVLEWVTISFSRGSSWSRDRTRFPELQADALPSEPGEGNGKPLHYSYLENPMNSMRRQTRWTTILLEWKLHHRKLIRMRKQKVISQMKGQDKTLGKELYKVEIGNLLEKEFRIVTVKMIQDLYKKMEKMQEMFTKI